MRRLVCKIFNHYWESYPKYTVMFDPPEQAWRCMTCRDDIEGYNPEPEIWTRFGWVHKLYKGIVDLKDKFDFRYRNIPF